MGVTVLCCPDAGDPRYDPAQIIFPKKEGILFD